MRNELPSIVMLHYVSDDTSLSSLRPWNISTKAFTRLLDYFQEQGYHTITFEDVEKGNRFDKEVIITFDDCPKHLWEFAIPELIKRKMKAVFYVLAGHLRGYNEWNVKHGLPRLDLMNEAEVKQMVDVGMEVGSHSSNHVMLEELTREESRKELLDSKKILEGITGKEVLTIAYPYGSLPVAHAELCEDAGYKYGLSVFTPWQDKYAIRRWIYSDEDTRESIKHKMSVWYDLIRAFEDKRRVWQANFLRAGYKKYSKLKSLIRKG